MLSKSIKIILLIITVVIAEYLYFSYHANARYAVNKDFDEDDVVLAGEVLAKSWDKQRNLMLSLMMSGDGGSSGKVRFNVPYLPWDDCAAVKVGDRVVLDSNKAKLKFIDFNSTDNSYEKYLIRQQYSGYGTAKAITSCELKQKGSRKEALILRLEQLFSFYGESLSILLATLLGEKSLVGDETKILFRETSTSHLLVISGLHVSIVFFGIYRFTKYILSRSISVINYCPVAIPALIASELVAIAYIFVSGFTIPSVRALIAISIFAISIVTVFPTSKVNAFLAAVLIILIIFPLSIFDVSFQLSFIAVLGIYIACQYIKFLHIIFARGHNQLEGSQPRRRMIATPSFRQKCKALFIKLLVGILNSFIISFFAWAFTVPVCLYWFQSIVPLGPLINLMFITPYTICVIYAGGISLILFSLRVPFSEYLVQGVLVSINGLTGFLEAIRDMSAEHGFGYFQLEGNTLVIVQVASITFCLLASLLALILQKRMMRNNYLLNSVV